MRLRLLLVFVGVVAVVLLAHDVPLASHLEQVERDRLTTKLERDAFILAGRVEEALENGTAGDDPAINALVARYAATEEVQVVVTTSTAIGVTGSDPSRSVGEDFSNRLEFVSALQGQPATGARESATLGEVLFYVAVPVLTGDDVIGAVRISAPERVVDERVGDRVRNLFIVAGLSLLIAVGVALVFAVYVTRPLERLSVATAGLARGNLSHRADVESGPPEVRSLAAGFNAMAERIERLVDEQREFAGTASHQLRTPLTALRLRLDQLADGVTDERSAAHAADAIVETERLHRMIEGLLALSRAEGRTDTVRVDLDDVVADRVAAWSALADERSVRLVADAATGRSVLAVDGAAEQIIDNLVDNALEVSPAGSSVTVRAVAAGDGAVELHVIDEGPGLDDDARARAFERFWRATDAPVGGSGLGLSIVRQLARAGGGDAELRSAQGGGIDAVVRFSRAR
jgi:signal transduction histidine kinase